MQRALLVGAAVLARPVAAAEAPEAERADFASPNTLDARPSSDRRVDRDATAYLARGIATDRNGACPSAAVLGRAHRSAGCHRGTGSGPTAGIDCQAAESAAVLARRPGSRGSHAADDRGCPPECP